MTCYTCIEKPGWQGVEGKATPCLEEEVCQIVELSKMRWAHIIDGEMEAKGGDEVISIELKSFLTSDVSDAV